MKHGIIRFICLLTVLTFLFCQLTVYADETADSIISRIENEYGAPLLDGGFAELAGSTQADWFAFALGRINGGDGSCEYLKSLADNLPDADTNTVTNLHRIALTVTALGGDPRNFGGRDIIAESIFYHENLGLQGVNGYIWALITLDSVKYEIPDDAITDRKALIDSILGGMLENGSYSLNGNLPDTDVTAMAITALSPYCESDDEVKQAVEKSIVWLSETQKGDGGFAAWGTENTETTAQVIIALCTYGIDIKSDERFIKNGKTALDGLMKYYVDGQGFAHIIDGSGKKTYNDIATAQALCALTSIRCANKDERLYELQKSTYTEVSEEAEETTPEKVITEEKTPIDPKFVLIAIAVAAGILILLFVARKVSRKKDVFIVIIAVIIIIALIAGSDIQSVEDYYQEHLEDIRSDSPTVTLSIKCDEAIKSKLFKDSLIADGYIPDSGMILTETEYVLRDGDSAFDILVRAIKHEHIHMEYQGENGNGIGTVYIEGISYLYEFDCGPTSGWMYKVNGEDPNFGVSQYYPKDGDVIEFYYTVDYTQLP